MPVRENIMAPSKTWQLCFACCLVLPAFVYGMAANEPFRSLKAPAETIHNYEVVRPVVEDNSASEEYPRQLTVTVQSFTLHLDLNKILLPPHFTSRYYDEAGNEIVEKGHVNCFYQGTVEGHPDWTATLSTCHGLQGSFGNLGDRDQYFHIEPLSQLDTSLEQPHALYLASELPQREASCGSKGHERNSDAVLNQQPVLSFDNTDIRQRLRRQTVNGILIVEWALVNDNRQYLAYGSNLTAVVLRDIEIANYVSGLYSTLPVNIQGVSGVRISLVSVTTWTSGDQISVSSNPNTLLDRFQEYAPRIGDPNDSSMLITGINLDGNTVGIAFIRTMCSDTASVGVSQDGGASLESIGSTASHELGHIFNMNHDDDRGCTCNDPSGECIMSAVSGFPQPVAWSSCSTDDITTGFTNFNLARCLGNEPSVTVGDPVCGNGIRERDEICDCGSIVECQDPCCNATSCELVEGAVCSQGACCTASCQFRGYGETCREAMASTGGCDITEYCSGDQSGCPEDLHLQDGTSCSNGQAFCFSGSCVLYDEQCQFNYGAGSSVGIDDCFERHNVVGDQFGNCGSQGGAFVPCSSENALCGQLHCDSGSFINQNNLPVTTLRNSAFAPDNSVRTCLSFTTQPGADIISPGLVQDGSTCAPGMLCFMRQCVAASSLDYVQACSVGENGRTCSGNGTCNNQNFCSCDIGFAGDACASPFVGPGGGGGGGGGNGGVIAGAVIGVILGLVLLAGVTVGVIALVWYIRSNRRKSYPASSRSSQASNVRKAPHTQSQDNLLKTTVSVKTPRSQPTASYNAYKPPSTRVPPPANIGRRPPPPPANIDRRPPPPSANRRPPAPSKPVPQPVKPAPPTATAAASRPPPPSRWPPKPVEPVPAPAKPRPPPPSNRPPPVKPEVAGKPGKIQPQWPPADSTASNKPSPAPRKPVLPPPRK